MTSPVEAHKPNGSPMLLVVEDSFTIAQEIAAELGDLGYTVLGPAGNVASALALIRKSPPDGALLDVNLGRETSLPVADALAASNTPFLFLSGYDTATVLPHAYKNVSLLPKPFTPHQLARLVGTLFNDS